MKNLIFGRAGLTRRASAGRVPEASPFRRPTEAGKRLAIVSYWGLVSACVPYAETIKASFDVYRQSLLTAIGWHVAPSLEAERYQWAQVGDLWFRISPTDPDALGYQLFPANFRPPQEHARPALGGPAAASCAGAKQMAHIWRRIGAAAVVTAVIVGVLGAARQRVIHPSPFPGVAVVVAADQLQAFSAIRPGQLRLVHRGWSPFLSGQATTLKQVIGHALLSDVPRGQAVPTGQIGPAMPPRTVAVAAPVSPAASLAAPVSPGDVVNATPVCQGRSRDALTMLPAVKVLDVRAGPATYGTAPAPTTVVLAIPASIASQTTSALPGCTVALSPAS